MGYTRKREQVHSYFLHHGDSVVLVMELIYNILDADEVIENDAFYFNPHSDDYAMPSFWLKQNNLQVSWYSDNPNRGASCNFEPDLDTALFNLDTVREHAYDARGKEKKS